MSMIATVREFFKDVGVESRKVSWPTHVMCMPVGRPQLKGQLALQLDQSVV